MADLSPRALPRGFDELLSSNLVIVTGKGGVGKTTVSAALGLAGAAAGRRTLLVEVEGRHGLSRAFGSAKWDYTEREFRPGLWGTALDPADSVYEYLEMFYGLKRVQWAMERFNAVDFVTTVAPGLRDLLLIGKIYEIESRRREDGRRMYDLIVLDAPPTGRIVPFLKAPEGVTEIVRVGPIKRQAGQIRTMLENSERTQTILATLLEEMPVQETIESVAALIETGIAVGPIIANQVEIPRLDDETVTALEDLGGDGVAAHASKGGADLDAETGRLAVDLATSHLERLHLEESRRADLIERTGQPVLELPLLTGETFDVDDLEVLADLLAVQVGERGPKAREAPGFVDWLRDRGKVAHP